MSRENYSKVTLLQLKRLIEPRSVAIVGASSEIEKVGGAITRNALEGEYRGRIYLVNPNIKQIFGRKVYPSLEDIPDEIDLVEVIVPAPIVPSIIEQTVNKRAQGAIIVSSGFGEIGKHDLQNQVVAIAKKGGIRIIGPNCFGLINTDIGLDLTFTFSKSLEGCIAFISQSGAMCCGTLDWASKEELGFSKFINLGNKCDVDEADALIYLREDRKTMVIAMYIEGITDGRKLFEAIRFVSMKKPIIILKAGATEPGKRAAFSHTGSIAGQVEIVKAALKQAGAIMVEDIEEMFDSIQVFSQPRSKGLNVAIVSNAGGLAVLTADWCYRLGLSVPKFSSKLVEELKPFLPSLASPHNPVDMTGDADYERYRKVLKTITDAEEIDMIICIFVSQGLVTSDGPARAVVETQKDGAKPILSYWMGGNSITNGVRILKRGGIPVYSSPERTAKAAVKLTSLARAKDLPEKNRKKMKPQHYARVAAIIKEARSTGRKFLMEYESKEILEAYGIPVTRERLAIDPNDGVKSARKIGFPVVLKVCSPDIFHKSDIGGVITELKTSKEVKEAYIKIIINVSTEKPEAKISGILVQEMIPKGLEIIIGAVRDPQFGPVVMFGFGGVFVEVLKDVTFRLAPLSTDEAMNMIRETNGFKLLEGFREQKPTNLNTLAEIIIKVGNIMMDLHEVTEIDINPLIILSERSVAVDARIVLS